MTKNIKNNPFLRYEDKWVALDQKKNKVVLSASSLSSLYNKLEKGKKKDVVITKVQPFNVSIAPNAKA